MKRFCTVPQGLVTDVNGNPHYIHCGEPAVCKRGMWYVCEGHKKYYPINKWAKDPLEGEIDVKRDEDKC